MKALADKSSGRKLGTWLIVATLATLLSIAVSAQPMQATIALSIATPPAPAAIVGRVYIFQLAAKGGIPSYRWRLAQGSDPIPPGLQLYSQLGVISGVPTASGKFHFSLAVSDLGGPPNMDTKPFVIDVPSALTLDWKQSPRAFKEAIIGSVVVSNQTGQTVDLTVIIVAVNEVGKAFALDHQHFPLKAESDSPTISFGSDSTLPFGKYTIHADAIGEIASAKQIYRIDKQTADAFVIKQQ